MAARSKTYLAVKEKFPTDAVAIPDAVRALKEHARTSFDETVEIHIHLNIDRERSEQMVRGNAQLPAGSARQKRIVVFAADASVQKEAAAAGAALVGGEELIEKIIKDGKLDADAAVATPDMMGKIAKAAKILGPKGLMPNPKTGTVSPDPAAVIKELVAGKASFKMDSLGNIHVAVAKASWEPDKIEANIKAFLEAVESARPATVKGKLITTAVVKTTMSPAIQIVI